MGNDQKPMCSSYIAIEPNNFKISPFLLYGYHHTLQLKDIATPILLSHSTISNFYQSANWDFWGLGIPPFFFEIGTHYASIIVNIITKTPLTHSVHWGLTLHPLKHHPFLFAKPPLKSANYPSHPFQVIHLQKFFFSCTYIKIEFFSELL